MPCLVVLKLRRTLPTLYKPPLFHTHLAKIHPGRKTQYGPCRVPQAQQEACLDVPLRSCRTAFPRGSPVMQQAQGSRRNRSLNGGLLSARQPLLPPTISQRGQPRQRAPAQQTPRRPGSNSPAEVPTGRRPGRQGKEPVRLQEAI